MPTLAAGLIIDATHYSYRTTTHTFPHCNTDISCNYSHILRWCHNGCDGVSNHQPHGCLLNRLFRCRSKKTSKLRVTVLCVGNSPGTGDSPHKWPVTRKMFPFHDVIMNYAEPVMGNQHGFRDIVCGSWQEEFCVIGKEAHWPIRGWVVKSAEHCGADYKPLDRCPCPDYNYSMLVKRAQESQSLATVGGGAM